MSTKQKRVKVKKIKAWMILGDKSYGPIPTLFKSRNEAKNDLRYSLPHYVVGAKNKVIPCTITFALPTQSKKRV